MPVIQNKRLYDITQALYWGTCLNCDERLEWLYEGDADGSSWEAECCETRYVLVVAFVEASVEPTDED